MPKPKSGTGRKPEVVPPARKANGQPRQDPDQGLAPTIIKRLKDELIPRAKDKRLGSVLGIMHLQGILTETEVEAGFRYAADVGAYEASVIGAPERSSKAQAFEFGRKGVEKLDMDALERMDSELATKLKRRQAKRLRDIKKRYDRAQMYIPPFPILISTVVEEVCCNDLPVNSLHHPMLKKILRNLAERCYPEIIQHEDEAAKKRVPMSRKADAEMLAQSAVDEIEAWFKRQMDGAVYSFRLTRSNPRAPLGITAYGGDCFGGALERTIHLKRSGLMAEAVNAQLLKAAEAKGWTEAVWQKP